MSGHTPGEWRVGPRRSIEAKAFDGSWCNIADKIRGGSPEAAEANARLIAKAPLLPEMAEALRDLRAACTDAYKAARIEAEPFVRAGNILARYEEQGK